MKKEEAIVLLKENLTNQNMIKHCLASGAMMRGVYIFLKARGDDVLGTVEEWEVAGLLHDADAEKTTDALQGATVGEWVKDKVSLPVIHAMAAHNEKTGIACESAMDWALFAGEKVTGLIVAAALILPSKKLSDVTPDMVLRRFKEKSFARGASRENILMCDKLGMGLEDFVKVGLKAMQGIVGDLGL